MLYKFMYSEATDFEAFIKTMRENHPHICARKRFCCHPEEITEQLQKDLAEHGVTLEEIK